MPFIFNKIYPEVQSAGLLSHNFRIFVDFRIESDGLYNFLISVFTLVSYLDSIQDSPARIELTSNLSLNKEVFRIFPVSSIENSRIVDNGQILDFTEKNNFDFLVTENQDLINLAKEKDNLFEIGIYREALKALEVFVRGHEIPWFFDHPSWHMPWTAAYAMSDEFGLEANELYETSFRKLKLDEETLELTRSLLLNRVSNILHTRDKLLFYVQQRRFAKRQKWERQGFQFEGSYYLNFYYLLLWGGIDQLSRIINKALGLNVRRENASVSREDFLQNIEKHNAVSLAGVFRQEDFKKWIEQLRRNRHFAAHQGAIILSPIVEKPGNEPTDLELDQKAKSNPNWELMKRTLPPKVFEWYSKSLKESLRIARYRVIVDDAMVLKDNGKEFIFRPLANIEWDFNNFRLFVIRGLEALREFIQTPSETGQ